MHESFNTQIGLQLNVSCPSTGHIDDYIQEVQSYLNLLRALLSIPIDLKVSILFPEDQVAKLAGSCDIITCSNTIPYGSFPDQIRWKQFMGLEKFGGGGLSGAPIFPCVLRWIKNFRRINRTSPLKACGGIMCKKDVKKLILTGVNAIELGSVKLLRPRRVKSIIKTANAINTSSQT